MAQNAENGASGAHFGTVWSLWPKTLKNEVGGASPPTLTSRYMLIWDCMALYYLIFIVFYAVFGAIYSNTIVFLRAFDVLVSAKAHKLRLLLKRAMQKPRIYRICC